MLQRSVLPVAVGLGGLLAEIAGATSKIERRFPSAARLLMKGLVPEILVSLGGLGDRFSPFSDSICGGCWHCLGDPVHDPACLRPSPCGGILVSAIDLGCSTTAGGSSPGSIVLLSFCILPNLVPLSATTVAADCVFAVHDTAPHAIPA